MRNHGESPHAREHSLRACASDLELFIDDVVRPAHPTKPVAIIGHSLGGMIALHLLARQAAASERTHRVSHAAILDISPGERPSTYHDTKLMVASLEGVAMQKFKSLSQAESAVRKALPKGTDPWLAPYFASNFRRAPGSSEYAFVANLPVIKDAMMCGDVDWAPQLETLFGSSEEARAAQFTDVTPQFVFGSLSPYYSPSAVQACQGHFPGCRIDVIDRGTHFAPVMQYASVAALVKAHLKSQCL